ELMKPVPVERLRFKCSCGAGDARTDKASKTLAVCGKACTVSGNPALSSAGCLDFAVSVTIKTSVPQTLGTSLF
ncbi:hypothetical protein, partial [Duodenibacillus massiliensis]|uniref:hypothetical protein n=1 Tax=Duodenibacillus massiliensis TaxID=1852381 RepID=UPI00307C11C2